MPPRARARSSRPSKIPLDIYIMLDQSSSMTDTVSGGGTKWSAVTGALNTFVAAARSSTGVSVGCSTSACPAGGEPCTAISASVDADCGAAACGPCTAPAASASVSAPSASAATRAPRATTRPRRSRSRRCRASPARSRSSIGGHSPTHGDADVGGARKARSITRRRGRQAHAGDAVVVVLATDGDPTECDTSPPRHQRDRGGRRRRDAEDPRRS